MNPWSPKVTWWISSFRKKYSSCSELCDPSRRCYSINDQQQVFPGIHGRQWNMQLKYIPKKNQPVHWTAWYWVQKVSNIIIDLAKLQYFTNPENPEIRGCPFRSYIWSNRYLDHQYVASQIHGMPFLTPKKTLGATLGGKHNFNSRGSYYGNMQFFLCHQSTRGDPEV